MSRSTRIFGAPARAPFLHLAIALGGLFGSARAVAAPQTVRPEIVATYPHDREAFTQGLLFHEGKLYESTGLAGRSTLRRVALTTGAVERSTSLASNLFGEGLALVGDRFFVLTWQNHVALTYDLELNPIGSFDYTGEGWGLCYDGQRLVMSNGSSRLAFRNPSTFAVTGEVEVRGPNGPVANLNELECVGSLVYANVWQTNTIVRIDPGSGDVTGIVDASGLLTNTEAMSADVLNGIAHQPSTGHFFITGKLWPKLFEVRFPFESSPDAGASGSGGASNNVAGGDTETPAPAPPRSRSGSGCGCAAPRASSSWSVAFALGLAATALTRLRLHRRRGSS